MLSGYCVCCMAPFVRYGIGSESGRLRAIGSSLSLVCLTVRLAVYQVWLMLTFHTPLYHYYYCVLVHAGSTFGSLVSFGRNARSECSCVLH